MFEGKVMNEDVKTRISELATNLNHITDSHSLSTKIDEAINYLEDLKDIRIPHFISLLKKLKANIYKDPLEIIKKDFSACLSSLYTFYNIDFQSPNQIT